MEEWTKAEIIAEVMDECDDLDGGSAALAELEAMSFKKLVERFLEKEKDGSYSIDPEAVGFFYGYDLTSALLFWLEAEEGKRCWLEAGFDSSKDAFRSCEEAILDFDEEAEIRLNQGRESRVLREFFRLWYGRMVEFSEFDVDGWQIVKSTKFLPAIRLYEVLIGYPSIVNGEYRENVIVGYRFVDEQSAQTVFDCAARGIFDEDPPRVCYLIEWVFNISGTPATEQAMQDKEDLLRRLLIADKRSSEYIELKEINVSNDCEYSELVQFVHSLMLEYVSA